MSNAPPRPRPDSATLGRLLKLARTEWRWLALGTFFLLLGSGTGLLYPQGIRILIDEALQKGRPELIDQAALAMGLIFAVQGVALALRYYLFSASGERIVTRLRARLYESILRQEVGFFDTRRTGELTSRLSSDTTVLQNAVSANVSMVLRNGAAVVGGLGFLVYTSPTLTGLMLLVVPPVALGAMAYGRKVRGLSREVQDALAKSNEVAEESIAGIRTVRSFDAEGAEARRYGVAVDGALSVAVRRVRASATFIGVASFLSFGAAAVVLWYGGRLVMDGSLTVGELTSFLVYTMIVAFSLGALSDLWADFMRAAGAAERVFELMDRAPQIPTSGGLRPAQVDGEVALEDLHFAYPSRKDMPVLQGLSLTLKAGEIVALVGPSGAGKSTVAQLLARFYDPDLGVVRLDGQDVRSLDAGWLRQQVGTVAQEPILFSTTIADNIRYARPAATDAEVEAAARTANADGFVRTFPQGYQTQVGERGVQLSGGQKQRIAIARAVLKDPRILVLDEATSALDAESEHLVKEALDRLMRGRTTLIIAHRLSTVMDAHRVAVLDGGRVVQHGEHRTLMHEEGLYRRLVERQFVAA